MSRKDDMSEDAGMALSHHHGRSFIVLSQYAARREAPDGGAASAAYDDIPHALLTCVSGRPCLMRFEVPEHLRGQGEGRRLLDAVKRFMRENGLQNLVGTDTSEGFWHHLAEQDEGVDAVRGIGKPMSIVNPGFPEPGESEPPSLPAARMRYLAATGEAEPVRLAARDILADPDNAYALGLDISRRQYAPDFGFDRLLISRLETVAPHSQDIGEAFAAAAEARMREAAQLRHNEMMRVLGRTPRTL
jgi:GNAT superfamily N-acetyltransferase